MIEVSKHKSGYDYCQILESPVKRDYANKYRVAINQLSQNYMPENVICRDYEFEEIESFVKSFIRTGKSKESLYISGCPGIGKTMIIKKIFEQSKAKQQYKKAKAKFIPLNAMNMKQPQDIYKSLYVSLASQTSNPPKKSRISNYSAMLKLDAIFRQMETNDEVDEEIKQMKKIVFIDEIDYLHTREEDILYNLFEWAYDEDSNFTIISISNTLDFPDRLKQKVKSRLGNKIMCFKPYNCDQMEQIINQRMEKVGIFEKVTIHEVIKRIAQTSSDLRKCFQIFKKAITNHTSKIDNQFNFSVIPSETVGEAYDETYNDSTHIILLKMPKPVISVLGIVAKHFLRDVRYMTLQAILQQSKNHLDLSEFQTKAILLDLVGQGLLQHKFSTNHSDFKNLRKWLYKIKIDSDKVMSVLYSLQIKI